eukprot:GILK01012298.1.p1 GENE.GILK01012298.1~~GILK01012298.1.p1  ORF type:complete len:573 (-),score=81.24 GILK01012298.1:151-1869(-)
MRKYVIVSLLLVAFFLVPIVSKPTHPRLTAPTLAEVSYDEDGNAYIDGTVYSKAHKEPHLHRSAKPEKIPPGSAEFWIWCGMITCCVFFGAITSGLLTGILSQDPLKLAILEMEGTETEKRHARAVLPFVRRHHLFIVTVILANAMVMESLPIFLENLVPEYVAVILSTTIVLFFGEIIPQAVFTSSKQLAICAHLTWLVRTLILLLCVVSWPISYLLDKWFGEENVRKYRRAELRALIQLHGAHTTEGDVPARRPSFISEASRQLPDSSKEDSETTGLLERAGILPETRSPVEHAIHINDSGSETESLLNQDEITIIQGALEFRTKTAGSAMVPIESAYMLEAHTLLDEHVMASILASGYSRIPVYHQRRNNLRGIILVKRLIVVDPDDKRPLHSLPLRKPIVVSELTRLPDLLNQFQNGSSHMAVVTRSEDVESYQRALQNDMDVDPRIEPLGIITIEDVIEQLIQEEIRDEGDRSELCLNHCSSRVFQFGMESNVVQRAKRNFLKLLSRAKAKHENLPASVSFAPGKCRVTSKRSAGLNTASPVGSVHTILNLELTESTPDAPYHRLSG